MVARAPPPNDTLGEIGRAEGPDPLQRTAGDADGSSMRFAVRLGFGLLAASLAVMWLVVAAHGFRGAICLNLRGHCRPTEPLVPALWLSWTVPLAIATLVLGIVSLQAVERRRDHKRIDPL
jgi:hypothetical protein